MFRRFPIFLFIFALMVGWIFSGWPPVWNNPRTPAEVEKVEAAGGLTYEAGFVTITDSLSWQTITLEHSYSQNPVIVATPVTINNCGGTCSGTSAGQGGMYPIPLIRNVTTTSFDISMCIDGGSVTCDTSASSETLNYFVFNVDNATNYDWIEVGTTTSVTTNGSDTVETYSTSFSAIPDVWTQAQTYSQGGEIGAVAWVEDNGKTTSGFTYVGCVHTGTGDSCDSNNSSETFGYVAIDVTNEAFPSSANFQSGMADISTSNWTSASFSPSFSNPLVMVTQNDDDGGQDPEYVWAKDVIGSGMEFRYCEEDAGDVCNTHTSEKTYWFALEELDTPTLNVDEPDGTGDTVTAGDNYSIQYDLADTDDVITAAFFYDTNSSGLDGTAITGACATAAEGTNATCTWDTTGMTSGSYYVYATTTDTANPEVSDYSSGQITINEANSIPVASAVSIDSAAASVTLIENTTTSVVCAGTVTDTNGYADISSVTADFYRTSVATSSPVDNNNYYQLSADANCVPSGGSGNSETYTCTFAVEYYADATDASGGYPSDDWTCMMTPTDSVGQGDAASDAIEINTLLALSVTSSISYGTLNPNTDTGATNQTTTVTNTGNVDMDPQLSGTDMTCSENTIVVGQQKYSGSAFTYSFGGTALTISAATLNVTLPQRTDGVVADAVLWGIGIPNGTLGCTPYSGTNTFTSIAGI